MYRRIGSVLVVALLVSLAGCTGGLDALGDAAADAGGDGGDTSDGVAGSSDGGDRSTGDDDAAGDGSQTLIENRTAVFREAGSYSSVWELRVTEGGTVSSSTAYTTAVDYANERSAFGMRTTSDGQVGSDYETYYADGQSYTRYGEGEDATYSVADGTFAPGQSLFSAQAQSYVSELSGYERVGTETYDGVRVTRYEETQRPTWFAGGSWTDGEVRWTEYTYSVLVDGDGLVRSEGWSAEGVNEAGATVTIEYSYSVTGVGSTTVDEPDWARTAREGSQV
jgi:hypothetical protein